MVKVVANEFPNQCWLVLFVPPFPRLHGHHEFPVPTALSMTAPSTKPDFEILRELWLTVFLCEVLVRALQCFWFWN